MGGISVHSDQLERGHDRCDEAQSADTSKPAGTRRLTKSGGGDRTHEQCDAEYYRSMEIGPHQEQERQDTRTVVGQRDEVINATRNRVKSCGRKDHAIADGITATETSTRRRVGCPSVRATPSTRLPTPAARQPR